MKYNEINNISDIDKLLSGLSDFMFLSSEARTLLLKIKDGASNIKLYGYFLLDEVFDCDIRFIYGISSAPAVEKVENSDSIFSKLKTYGLSNKFKGLLGKNAQELIPPIYDTMELLGEEYLIVSKNNKRGVYSLNGELICPVEYDTIEIFGDNYFRVSSNEKWGVYSYNGELICPVEYDKIFEMSEYTFASGKDEKVGFHDTYGNIVIEHKFRWVEMIDYEPIGEAFVFRNGIAKVYTEDGKIGYCFHIDHYGNQIDKEVVAWDFTPEDDEQFDWPHPSDSYFNDGPDYLEGDWSNGWNID